MSYRATIQCLRGFAETSGETIMHQGDLENTLKRIEHTHLTLGGISTDFNFVCDLDITGLGLGIFYVALQNH